MSFGKVTANIFLIMKYLSNDKLVIVGAAGMIGSNMAQTAIMMGLSPNICLYDPYAPGLKALPKNCSIAVSGSQPLLHF